MKNAILKQNLNNCNRDVIEIEINSLILNSIKAYMVKLLLTSMEQDLQLKNVFEKCC